MEKTSRIVANSLLFIINQYCNGDCSDILEIKKLWHDTVFLFFSLINHRRLFDSDNSSFDEMVKLGLMPGYLFKLYSEKDAFFKNTINNAVEEYNKDPVDINVCRQDLLNMEMDFTGLDIKLIVDKTSRDSTGSYYTPKNLALETIKAAIQNFKIEKNQAYKIADFSCGCGDFFIAAIDYLKKTEGVDYNISAEWFYGVDIDPIALQICVVNILTYVDRSRWRKVVSHFTLGNPLLINEEFVTEEERNNLFATNQLYSTTMGLPLSFFNESYDIIIGNPPWEKIRFEERKFFRGLSAEISAISRKSARDEEVRKLEKTWPELYKWRNQLFKEYSHMSPKKYRHTKIEKSVVGELNTYALFTELSYNMLTENGVLALVVKSTLLTAPANQKIWNSLLTNNAVNTVYLFENKEKLFSIDSRERFAVIVAGRKKHKRFVLYAGLTNPNMIEQSDYIRLSRNDISLINPKTLTIPNVNSVKEIVFLRDIHKKFELFMDVYPECHFGRLIHLTAHSRYIDKNKSANNTPIYEGKFIEQYDARYSSFKGVPETKKYANKASALVIKAASKEKKELPESRFFVSNDLWHRYKKQYNQEYSLCWRSLTSPSNRRTMIAMILPTCPTCQSIQMLQTISNEDLVMMLALFNSIPFDYLVRIKMPGLDLTQSVINQIPVPSKKDYEEMLKLDNNECTIKKHIMSYVVSILEEEPLLKGLVETIREDTYSIEGKTGSEKQEVIDFLFKEAYHLDNDTYDGIIATFPKYQAARIVCR